jgi:hypothetical protein
VLTLHGKGVKKWLSHAGRGDAVAAGMKPAGRSGVVFGGHADAIRVRVQRRRRRRRKVELYSRRWEGSATGGAFFFTLGGPGFFVKDVTRAS